MKECRKEKGWKMAKAALLLAAAMLVAAQRTPVFAVETDTGTSRAAAVLNNPRIVSDSSMTAGQKTTWDCVYFGSYPQSGVTGDELTSAITGAAYDANGDAYVDGTKYRRRSNSGAGYSYYKWETVKWRVLHTDGNTALLLSDIALDTQPYHTSRTDITWEKSTIRSWLNGYDVTSNSVATDYSINNFIDAAFTVAEQAAIRNTSVENKNNLHSDTDGGNDTIDKLFLLSESETYATDEAAGYGFIKDGFIKDEARRCECSAYACYGSGWWLRSPGSDANRASVVFYDGRGYCSNAVNVYDTHRVRVALNLDLSSVKLYCYAGTVSSDGTSEGVYTSPSITAPFDQTVKFGTSTTFSVTASGGNPSNYTYQWYYAASQSGTGTRISGAMSSSYTISSSNMTSSLNGRYYYCVVSNGQYEVESSRAKLTVYSAPSVTAPSDQSIKFGTGTTFSVTASGGNPSNYTYQWYYAASRSGTGTRISGATSSSYTISSSNMTSALNGRYYYCVVSNGQYEVESGRAKLTVYTALSVTIPSSQSVKSGTSVTFGVTASGGSTSNYSYQWYYAISQSGAGMTISGATSPTYTIAANNVNINLNGRYYYCVVSNGQDSVTSSRAILTVQADDTTEPVLPPGGNQTEGNQNTGGLKRQIINAVSRTIAYRKKAFSLGVSTDGGGRLTYQSSNPKVAAVLSDGRIKMKNFGMAVITINASQTASYAAASKQITIQVVPKKGGLKQASSPYGRCIKLAWKKDKKASGYEVQISMSKSFQSKTVKRLYKKGKTGTTLIGLQSKKKYYVRVRSYAKAGKRKVYGDWSKVRTVKIR